MRAADNQAAALRRSESAAGQMEKTRTLDPRSVLPDYIIRNKAAWEQWAPSHIEKARDLWADGQARWGIWGVPEDEIQALSGVATGADVIELGCGTASLLAGLAGRGFRPVGVDFSRAQLEAAAKLQKEFGIRFPLLCANAEELPYGDASFDCVVSDYGVSLWCNPSRWVPEAARLLRLSGRLVFVTSSATLLSCTPDSGGPVWEQLVRDYFSRYRVEFQEDGAVEFHVPLGRWVRVLRAHGFVLDNVIETRPPPEAEPRYDFVSNEWARRWPSEEIWIATKVA